MPWTAPLHWAATPKATLPAWIARSTLIPAPTRRCAARCSSAPCTHAVGPALPDEHRHSPAALATYTHQPARRRIPRLWRLPVRVCARESIDLLAEKVGLRSVEIRYRNAIEPGEVLPNGQIADCSTALKETLLGASRMPTTRIPGHAGIACAMKNAGVGVGLLDAGRCKIRVENGVAVVWSVPPRPTSARAATPSFAGRCRGMRSAASLHRQRRVLHRRTPRPRHHVRARADGRDRRGRARCRLPAACAMPCLTSRRPASPHPILP